MNDFIDGWLKREDKNPHNLSPFTIQNDRWDRRYYNSMLKGIDAFMIGHEEFAKNVDTGDPMWQDLFVWLWKVAPELTQRNDIRPDHLLNYMVAEEMAKIPDFERLKFFAENDDVACALACIDLREHLEALFDRLQTMKQIAEKLQEQMQQLAQAEEEKRDIDEMLQDWASGHNPDQQQGEQLEQQRQEAQQKIDEIIEGLDETGQDLSDEEMAARAQISQAMRRGLEEAAQSAENLHSQQELWSTEPGTLQRMPMDERIQLAKRLNNERFRKLFDLLGPLRRIMEDAQLRRAHDAMDEMHRITVGEDLQRVLPSELAKAHHPQARKEFVRKWFERELPQYEFRGKEKVGRGEMIVCIDDSGSMYGEKEMFAKAVGVTALHLARKQKRGFYGIHFGSPNEIQTFDFGLESQFTPERVCDFVEFFYNGGTDFVTPLTVALQRLQKEHEETGKVKGDILFITDGICGVPQDWLQQFKDEQHRLEFRIFGFLIGGYGKTEEPLNSICDGRVWEVSDMLNPNETRGMMEAL